MLPSRWLVYLSVIAGIIWFWTYSPRDFKNGLEGSSSLPSVPKQILIAFQAWKTKYNKAFLSPSEEKHRLGVFWRNYIKVSIETSLPYSLKLNMFADLTEEEFSAKYLSRSGNLRNRLKPGVLQTEGSTATSTNNGVDWRTQGAVTPVKNQMDCTSGWAFAATSAFESAAKIAGYPLVALSEQQLVDCSSSFGNSGCHGGWIDYSFEYIMSFGGLDSDAQYPYKGYDQRCKSSAGQVQPPKIDDYEELPANDCSTLFTTVAQQPVPTRIAANAIQFYSSGVFSNKYCGTELNHAVLIVGYGTDSHNKKNYWIAKNSWGSGWGEHGYIYLDRDVMPSTGICGICMDSLIPLVKKPSAN